MRKFWRNAKMLFVLILAVNVSERKGIPCSLSSDYKIPSEAHSSHYALLLFQLHGRHGHDEGGPRVGGGEEPLQERGAPAQRGEAAFRGAQRCRRYAVLRIRDVYPGSKVFPSRIPDPNFFHPGSASKNLSILF
jgi:hypothetical protein